jgi:hypothetical protein
MTSTFFIRLSELAIGITWTGTIAASVSGVTVALSPWMLAVGLIVGSLGIPLLKQIGQLKLPRKSTNYMKEEFVVFFPANLRY